MRAEVTSTILPAEPIPAVTVVTDGAGLVGVVAPKVAEELHLGPLSAAASILNDRSNTNLFTNLLGLLPGFGGPMAITGAFNDWFDYGIHHNEPGEPKHYDDPELRYGIPVQDDPGCAVAGLEC